MGLGLICSCFGHGHQEPGEAACTQGSSNPLLQNVVSKFKSFFHRGQVEAEASGYEAATAPSTATAPAASTMLLEDQTRQQSGQLLQTLNKAQIENNIPSQQKGDFQQELKPVAKEAAQTKVKHWRDFQDSSEIFPSSDDEDVCPTCLEEYDEENPKITTQCHHHYHLACIFAWREGSSSCPVCGKVMVFEQMTVKKILIQ